MNEALFGGSRCTIVVPCYNEEERLPVDSFRDFIRDRDGIRFLFVNDGSQDKTLALLQSFQEAHPEAVGVLNQPRNMGKAEAVRCGMLQAIANGAIYTGFWDADLATPLSEIPRLLGILVEKPRVEMVLGARVRLLGRHVTRRPLRHYSGRIFATIASMTLNLPIYDTQCGAKLFRVTPTLSKVLATPFHSRWTFDVELLARFLTQHSAGPEHAVAAIYEEPLQTWEDVAGSKLKVLDSLKSIGDMLAIRQTYFKS